MSYKISPLAAAIAKANNIDIATIKGTGINNKIMSSDIYNNQNNNNNNNPSGGQDYYQDISTIRGAIAKAMTTAKNEIPFTTLTFFVDVTNLVNYRKQIKDQVFQKYQLKLSYLPFLVKAATYAIKKYPVFNSSYDASINKLLIKSTINFGIAVDTENGLMVPNIKDVEKLSIIEIGHKITELAKKARDKKLTLAEIKHGTISLTNFGSIGAAYGVPIINYPEVAIIAPGNIEERLAANATNQIIVKHLMPITIAADHRWIDGADIGRFMKEFAMHLETLDGLVVN